MTTSPDATPTKPDHNSLGKAAFIIGLIALALSFVPIVGFVAWLMAPLAILFGLIALRRSSRSLAIAGIITGACALLICLAWVKGMQEVGAAMNADAFNRTGNTVDNSSAPVVAASISGLWDEIEENKIAAGRKYGGRRLAFTNEVIHDFEGDAARPRINFRGKEEEFLVHLVSAAFSEADGERIAALRRGARVSFVCERIRETIGSGYSLSNCALRSAG